MTLAIACLCAAWCRTCDAYAPVLAEVAAEAGMPVRWIDVEDEADLVGEVDVETFPTLLLHEAGAVRYFGPVTPQAETLRRLLRGAAGARPAVPAEVQDLARRLAAA